MYGIGYGGNKYRPRGLFGGGGNAGASTAQVPIVQGTPRTREQAQAMGLIGGSAPRSRGYFDELAADPFTTLFLGTNGLDRKYASQQAEQEAARMAPQRAWMEDYVSKLPEEQRYLALANGEEFAKNMAQNYAPQNVAGGNTLIMGGDSKNPIYAPKMGESGGYTYTQTPKGTQWGPRRGMSYSEAATEDANAETARHNRAMEGVAGARLAFDKSKPQNGAGLTPYQGLNFQFKLDDLDRELATTEQKRRDSMMSLDNSISLLDKFTGDEKKFAAVYGNMMNPNADKNDLFNWSIAMDPDRADGMAILNQLGGQAFIDSIQSMKGTGSLSDAEGAKVATAATRLMTVNQSDDAAKQAAAEFRNRLVSYKKALESDMARSRESEAQRRARMIAMMGAVAATPAQAAQPAATASQASDDELRALLGLD